MIAGSTARWTMLTVGIFAVVGFIDAATGRNWDLVAVFGVIVVLSLAASLRLPSDRRAIRIRGDLAQWLALRAAEGDEPVGRVADRAVAAYRFGLADDRES